MTVTYQEKIPSPKRLTRILPKLPPGCYYHESASSRAKSSQVLTEDLTPDRIVIDTSDDPSFTATYHEQASCLTSTFPRFPQPHGVTQEVDAPAQSTDTPTQFLIPFNDEDTEYLLDLESLARDPLELVEADLVKFASASEQKVLLPRFGSTRHTSSKDRNFKFKAQTKDKSAEEGARKARNCEAIRIKLLKCLHGDALLKSSMNWRDWVTKNFTYCKLCLKELKIKEENAAIVHLAVAHNLYVCSECDVVSKSSSMLVMHMKDAHQISKEQLVCVICQYLFINASERDKHICKIHTWKKYEAQSKAFKVVQKSSVPSILKRKRQ